MDVYFKANSNFTFVVLAPFSLKQRYLGLRQKVLQYRG